MQAKRYKQNAPIRLEAVAALKAIVDNENANRGLFVTTSRFLPGVRKFAQQQSRRLELATSEDISKWCRKINEQLQKSSYTDVADEVMQMLKEGNVPKSLVGKIVHTRWGYNMIINKFRLVIKETSKAVLLKELPTEIVNHDGYEQSGYEIPIIPDDFQLKPDDEFHYIRARKEEQDGKLFFWGDDQNLYTIWNGQPQYFDYCDWMLVEIMRSLPYHSKGKYSRWPVGSPWYWLVASDRTEQALW